MATSLFWRNSTATGVTVASRNGQGYTNLAGTANLGTSVLNCFNTRGSGATQIGTSTVAGPTPGVEFLTGSAIRMFITPMVATQITISSAITFNIWAFENNMSANAAINVRILLWRNDGSVSVVHTTTRTVELATSSAVNNWNETPTSFTINAGDRLMFVPFIDDAGTMAATFSATIDLSAGSAGVVGDTYVQFTENLTFADTGDPSGTTIYATDSAASGSINPGSATEKEVWTSRGGGVQTAVTNSVAGPTSKIQITATAGGTAVEWYTRPLQAVTLNGWVLVNMPARESAATVNGTMICEIAVVDGDGTNPVVWGQNGWGSSSTGELSPTAESVARFYVQGASTSIAAGKRLRIRFYIDDVYDGASLAMASGGTATLYYAGAAGATGDLYLTFPVTLAEHSAGESHDGTVTATGGGVGVLAGEKGAQSAPVLTGGGVVVAAVTTDRQPVIAATGGGVVAIVQTGAHNSNPIMTGGGVAVLVAGKDVSSSLTATGGGVGVLVVTKNGESAPVATGGGVAVLVTSGSHNQLATGTGAGVAIIGAEKAASGAPAATGGGTFVPVIETARSSVVVGTGGGVLTYTYDAGAGSENHEGTVTGTGGGVAVLAIQKGGESTVTATASGALQLVSMHGGAASVAGTGAGVLLSAGTKGGENATTATGGGVVVLVAAGARGGFLVATGAGIAQLVQTTDRNATFTATGGGVAVLVSGSQEQHSGTVTATGGGIAVLAFEAARAGTVVGTGAGVVLPDGQKGASLALTATGGGTHTSAGTAGKGSTVLATGSGIVITTHAGIHLGSAIFTGGGTLAVAAGTDRFASVVITGGGMSGIIAGPAVDWFGLLEPPEPVIEAGDQGRQLEPPGGTDVGIPGRLLEV